MQAVKFVPLCFDPNRKIKKKEKDENGVEKEIEVDAPAPKLSGHLMLLPPTIEQRFEYLDLLGLEVKPDGEYDVAKNGIKTMRTLLGKAKDHYKGVEVKYVDGSKVMKSYEEISIDPECTDMMTEVASQLVNGFTPSKN